MKRITPEDVVDAYIATGMYPCTPGLFYDGIGGACGLSAIVKSIDQAFDLEDAASNRWLQLLGITNQYLWGFIDGFDGNDSTERCKVGFEDGKAARSAVEAHFAKATSEQPQEVATCGTP